MTQARRDLLLISSLSVLALGQVPYISIAAFYFVAAIFTFSYTVALILAVLEKLSGKVITRSTAAWHHYIMLLLVVLTCYVYQWNPLIVYLLSVRLFLSLNDLFFKK